MALQGLLDGYADIIEASKLSGEMLHSASRNNYATIGGDDEIRTFEAKVVQSASVSQSA